MEVITWNGKRYPRFGGDMMSVTEAMHRLNATQFFPGLCNLITIYANNTDVPEGVDPYTVRGIRNTWHHGSSEDHVTYRVYVEDIEQALIRFGLPSCKYPSPELQAAMDDVKVKESRVNSLRQIADAATFAIEQSKGDVNCEVTNELLTHWHDQEHDYLVALGELEVARANLKKLS